LGEHDCRDEVVVSLCAFFVRRFTVGVANGLALFSSIYHPDFFL
jgi:hypothetical protein